MCCGKKANRVEIPPEVVDGESVLIRYSGDRKGTFSVHGRATGTDYSFNNGSQAVQAVNEGDASYILSLPYFGLV